MEISVYSKILSRGWWVIALTTLTALATALASTFFVTPKYESIATFIITPSNALVNRTEVLNSLNTLGGQSVISTYTEIMNSTRIYTDALALLKVQPIELKDYKYETTVLANSTVLELKVNGPDPQMAAKFANAIGYQTINFTRQLNQVFNVDFLDAAAVPVEPVSPNPILNVGLAIVLGLIVGAALVILTEQLRIPLETIRQRLHYDEITGVFKRKYLLQLLDEELTQSPGNLLSIGIVDLSGIRDLVETIPVVSLQKILKKTTDVLRKELRGSDVIGRWNDNSFVIMLPNTNGTAAKTIFKRIFQALSGQVELEELNIVIELAPHIGGAEYSSGISSQELLEKTNTALEQARRTPADPVYVWELKNPFWAQSLIDQK